MRLPTIATAAAVTALLVPATAGARAITQPVGFTPLSSKKATKKVHRSAFEPRPDNTKPNHLIPKRKQLRNWHAWSEMPYAAYVNGRFRGTTDEIIQWAAETGNSLIDVAQFKEIAGISRKYAIPLLEHFDRTRVTRRAADKRVIL